VDDLIRATLDGEEAYVVGGAVRDDALGREIVDIDVACRDPLSAARAYRDAVGGAVFLLSERHRAWRVARPDGRTVDFTLLRATIQEDLAGRDFTVNAVAIPLPGGDPIDPFGGLADLERRVLRAVSDGIFTDDPLRLLRAVRLEDELGLRLDSATERLVRHDAPLVAQPAGERILAELERLSARGYERLAELGLLEPLGGDPAGLARAGAEPDARTMLVASLGSAVERLPVSNETRRFARVVLRATPPDDSSPRAVHRFRRATEPWALQALAFHGRSDLADAIAAARAAEPAEPLVRGDELGVPPGPEVGRLLDRIAEERAAGTIRTRAEALELARRHVS
jgi:hypothetical protein